VVEFGFGENERMKNPNRILYALILGLCHCSHRPDFISIQSRQVTLDGKRVELGSLLKNWQAQFGSEDTSSAIWVQWRSAGLLAYFKTNPCGIEHVTGFRVNLKNPLDAEEFALTHSALLNDFEINAQSAILEDTITWSRSGGHSKMVFHAASKSFQVDDTAYYVLLEVDEKRRPSQLFYALSSEACAKLGLELSIEEEQAFRSLHCSAAAPSLTIENRSVTTPEGKVFLGETFEQWKKQWGTPDSFSFGVASWPKWGLDINYSVNACNEKRVTAFSIYYRVPVGMDLPSTRMPIRLEDCVFQFDDTLQGDTLNCGNQKSKKPLLLLADDAPKPSEIFFRSRSETGLPQRKKSRTFKSESADGLIAIEVDTLGRLARLDYSLSNEQAYRIGLERSPQQQKDFADSGKCGSIPSLWEP
jgi:hypothetical protein